MTTASLQVILSSQAKPKSQTSQHRLIIDRWSYGRSYWVMGWIIPLVLASLLWVAMDQSVVWLFRAVLNRGKNQAEIGTSKNLK